MTLTRAQLGARARDDLARLRTPAGWIEAGRPRYPRLFGRDACITAWQLLDDDPRVAVATVRALAALQGKVFDGHREEQPGKIPHEVPVRRSDRARMQLRKQFRWGFPYYGSIDATSWWVRLVDAHRHATGNDALRDEVAPLLERAAAWMAGSARIGAHDLVAYQRANRWGLLHQGWRDADLAVVPVEFPVAIVEVQGYHAAAAAALARMEIPVPVAVAPDKVVLQDRAVFHDAFWMASEGTYALAVGGDGRQVPIVTSNPGHLLGTPLLDRSNPHLDQVVDRLFGADLWTAAGIRTHSTAAPHFDPDSYQRGSVWPHDNWIIHQGLLAVGRHDEAARVRAAVLDATAALEAIPELYAVHHDRPVALAMAQPCQAWSAGAVLRFLAEERARG